MKFKQLVENISNQAAAEDHQAAAQILVKDLNAKGFDAYINEFGINIHLSNQTTIVVTVDSVIPF